MKRFLGLFVFLLISFVGLVPPVHADPKMQEGGQPSGLITSVSSAILAADTPVVLTAPSGHVVIQLSAASAAVSLNLNNGTATTSMYTIPAGGTFTYYGRELVGFHYIGATATGTISVAAW